jgi:hypothetical protein
MLILSNHSIEENTMVDATLKQVADFFRKAGETLKEFSNEWTKLTSDDKAQLKAGIGDGTLTY